MTIDSDVVTKLIAALLASALGLGLFRLNVWHSRARKAHPHAEPGAELNCW